MKLTITENKQKSLLERAEVQGTLEFEGATPSNNEVIGALAQQLGVPQEMIVIRHILTEFSKRSAQVQALAYASLDARRNTEPITAQMKKKREEAKKAEAEAKKAEAETKKAAEAKA